MDNQGIHIVGLGTFDKGKFLSLRTKGEREYKGHLQSCGEFLSLWNEDYMHCIRVSEILYIGTEHKVTDSKEKTSTTNLTYQKEMSEVV